MKDQQQLNELRRRLYERGEDLPINQRHDLTDEQVPVSAGWSDVSMTPPVPAPPDPRTDNLTTEELVVHAEIKPPRRYRSVIVLVSIIFFVIVAGLSSLYLFFGGNQISGRNIAVNISGPFAVGGGEVMPLQVTVTNQNKVPIESAVLIVQYPPGTKSTDDPPRDLFEERLPINNVAAGEAINIPIRAVVFGEENQEQSIRATVEYRLIDSNGTFFKEAEPLVFKINSSPLVISIDTVERVSSGQEVTMKVTLQSNASTPLRDILLSANYPVNFDYSSANPAPSFRQSEWLIPEIRPEGTATIELTGLVIGQQSEEFQLQFTAGTPRQDNQFIMGSVLATAAADFFIERPFINVELRIGGTVNDVVTLQAGRDTAVAVTVQNTLTETLYDMNVEVSISGNVLARQDVTVNRGFYDSINDVIRWDVSGDNTLSQVSPGETKRFIFTLRPSDQALTPTFSVTASTYARRVSEANATEQLVGTAESEVRFTSAVNLDRVVTHIDGPHPPVADRESRYQVTLEARAGGNDVTGTVVTTALPQYVSWLDVVTGDGSIVYNPVSKEITWNIGSIEAESRAITTFDVVLLPSQNQIDRTPALIGTQRFRATDRFTGDVVRTEAVPLSAELPLSAGYPIENGRVRAEPITTNE